MQRSDFYYHLPDELIAQHPAETRGGSRLLHLNGMTGAIADRGFTDLPDLLRPEDLLVFNDTRVMQARMYGRKATGGQVEILIERVQGPHSALAHIRASKSPKPGSRILIGDTAELNVVGRMDDLFELASPDIGFMELMELAGHMPLPPYISRDDDAVDEERYQTVYADRPGAVAAPTAGLHFDQSMLDRLSAWGSIRRGSLCMVGAGTFRPVRVDRLEDHVMHSEYVEVSQATCEQVQATRLRGGRVVAVGTTSVRSLEAASVEGSLKSFTGDTRLFITPGYRFKSVDAMITNFHLPESTLLMLVSAFSGYEQIMAAYRHAVEQRYRFFSYGDAMFLESSAGVG